MRVSDVVVGDIIKGTIKRIVDVGVFVEISGSVDGVCWPLHLSDVRLKNPEKKFKIGQSIKCRVRSNVPDLR